MSTSLPLQDIHSILFEGKAFCFTGKFIYGSRNKCQMATEALGGACQDGVTQQLDYLVIGALASRDWRHSAFGRKILRAVELREKGHPVTILGEDTWARFV